MATPNRESIETFMSITGSSELVALQKLTEHGGNLNEAVNAHFTEGDRDIRHETEAAAPQEDFMDIDEPSEVTTHRPPPSSLLHSTRDINPFSLPASAPRIEEVSRTLPENLPETRGAGSIHEEDNADFLSLRTSHLGEGGLVGASSAAHLRPSAPVVSDLPDYGIEEEMFKAAIEASKRDAESGRPDDAVTQQRQSQLEDPELAHAVTLSLKSAEQEIALHELKAEAGPSEPRASKFPEVEEVRTLESSNGRLGAGGLFIQDETEDAEEQPLVRHRSRHMSSSSVDTATDIGEANLSLPSSPPQQQNINHQGDNGSDFPSDEWGGISSVEHDEAVMLEAALFGGIPEGIEYRVPYASHHYRQNGLVRTIRPYPRPAPRPPSPSLTAQRLIREQQDDEYLAALQADREKELQEQAAREAAMEEERRKEEEARIKLEEEQEMERQLAAKEASLPQEPTSDDENAVNLLVRMPDGTRRARRFVTTHKLQYLFDFVDVGRLVKPGTYRLVRPYPRRPFSEGESNLTLNELGLTSRQEALFLELI